MIEIVGEYWRGPTAEMEYQPDKPARGRYTQIWAVRSDLVYPSSVLAAFIAIGGATLGQGYLDDSASIAKKMSARKSDASQECFFIDISYEPIDDEKKEGKDENGNPTTDPLRFHDEIDVSYTQISVPVYRAKYQGGFVGATAEKVPLGAVRMPMNSALVPFNPPLEREEDIKVVRITKYKVDYNGQFYDRYQGRVNSAQEVINKGRYRYFDVWGQYKARIKSIGGQFLLTNGIPHWRVAFEIHVHPFGWRVQVPDRGVQLRLILGEKDSKGRDVSFTTIQPGQPLIERITDPNGVPITEPVLFDGNNGVLAAGLDPVYITWQIYEELAFGPLAL